MPESYPIVSAMARGFRDVEEAPWAGRRAMPQVGIVGAAAF